MGSRVRAVQAFLLLRPTARTIRWTAVLGGAVAAQLVVWASRGELSRGHAVALLPLRLAAVVLCLGAAFVLDDDAAATVEPAAATLVLRRGLRLVVAVPVVGLAWGAALWVASTLAAPPQIGRGLGRPLPAAGLTLEAGAMLAVTLAASVVATRSLGPGRGGVAGGPVLLAFLMSMIAVGPYWSLFPRAPADPAWTTAHVRWALILVAATVVIVGFSLDPARRAKIHLRRGRPRASGLSRVVGTPVGRKP